MKANPVFFLFCLPCLLNATLLEVQPNQSIQSAVNQAVNGDTILLHEGIYTETVVPNGKLLTFGSEFLIDHDSSHISTTLMIPDTGSCFVYNHFEPYSGVISGITMLEGHGTNAMNQIPTLCGGAIYISRSSVKLKNCRIESSHADYGGGIAILGRRLEPIRVELDNCDLIGCRSELWGGGIFTDFPCSLFVNQCRFAFDTSSIKQGSGICSLEGYAEVDHCLVHDCVSYLMGGIEFIGTAGRISHTVFENNHCWPDPESPQLGSIDLDVSLEGDQSLDIYGCLFSDDSMTNNSVILESASTGQIAFYGNVLEGISSTTSSTIQIGDGSDIDVSYCIFRNNSSFYSTIYTYGDSRAHIHHNVLDRNRVLTPDMPSVISTVYHARPTVDSNLFLHNYGQTINFILPEYPTRIHAENNWWGDPTGPYHPTLNPEGRGDTILSDSVSFIPWLTSPPDTTLPQSVHASGPPQATTWQLMDVFPNPFNSEIRLVVAGFAGDDYKITLHNIMGQQVALIHAGRLIGGEVSFHAPSTLASGIYFIRAASATSVQTRKIILLK